jgi:hypothetical protein
LCGKALELSAKGKEEFLLHDNLSGSEPAAECFGGF